MHFHFPDIDLPTISGTFTVVLQWVLQNGYPILFLGMIIEGPTVIAAASFAVTLGYFNLAIIFVLAVLGDLVGDFIWYVLGYFGRATVIEKYGHFFGASEKQMEKLRKLLEKHPGKILLAIKLSPLLPVPGLIMAGSTHMSPKKFAATIAAIILPKTVLFMAVGYYFGQAYDGIARYLNNGIYAIGIILVAGYLIHCIYKKVSTRIAVKLERD